MTTQSEFAQNMRFPETANTIFDQLDFANIDIC